MTAGRPTSHLPPTKQRALTMKQRRILDLQARLTAARLDFDAAVREAVEEGATVAAIARAVDINPNTLAYRLYRGAGDGGEA